MSDETTQVPVIDTYHVCLFAYVGKFGWGVQLKQDFQSQLMRLQGEFMASVGSEAGGNEEYRISSHDTCLHQLVFIDDEIFAQNGKVDKGTCGTDISQGTTKEHLIRQDGEGGSSGSFVCWRNEVGLCRLFNPTFGV